MERFVKSSALALVLSLSAFAAAEAAQLNTVPLNTYGQPVTNKVVTSAGGMNMNTTMNSSLNVSHTVVTTAGGLLKNVTMQSSLNVPKTVVTSTAGMTQNITIMPGATSFTVKAPVNPNSSSYYSQYGSAAGDSSSGTGAGVFQRDISNSITYPNNSANPANAGTTGSATITRDLSGLITSFPANPELGSATIQGQTRDMTGVITTFPVNPQLGSATIQGQTRDMTGVITTFPGSQLGSATLQGQERDLTGVQIQFGGSYMSGDNFGN